MEIEGKWRIVLTLRGSAKLHPKLDEVHISIDGKSVLDCLMTGSCVEASVMPIENLSPSTENRQPVYIDIFTTQEDIPSAIPVPCSIALGTCQELFPISFTLSTLVASGDFAKASASAA